MAAAGGGSGSSDGGSDMADFVGAFESDSDDGDLPAPPAAAPEPEPEPERPAAAAGVGAAAALLPAPTSVALSEAEIYAALRAVARNGAGEPFRSAAELEQLVKGLPDWRSAAVQQQLQVLCQGCAVELAAAPADGDEIEQDDSEDVNVGVVRVLTATVNCIDGARCEVEEGLLELLLRLKGAVGAGAGHKTTGANTGGTSSSIWRYEKVRMIPVLPTPWPELPAAPRATCTADSAAADRGNSAMMHVDLRQVGGTAATTAIAAALAAHGLCTCTGLLPADTAARARAELADATQHAFFKPALKGGEANATPRDDVVLWLDPRHAGHRSRLPTLLGVEERLAQLGAGLSRQLTASPGGESVPLSGRSGAMAACYRGSGAQYCPHIDNPCALGGAGRAPTAAAADDDGRRLAAIWYPNEEDWDTASDGAALRVWTTSSDESPFARPGPEPRPRVAPPGQSAAAGVVDVCPSSGTLALFWAHRTPHAVLPTTGKRPRYAVSVWFNA